MHLSCRCRSQCMPVACMPDARCMPVAARSHNTHARCMPEIRFMPVVVCRSMLLCVLGVFCFLSVRVLCCVVLCCVVCVGVAVAVLMGALPVRGVGWLRGEGRARAALGAARVAERSEHTRGMLITSFRNELQGSPFGGLASLVSPIAHTASCNPLTAAAQNPPGDSRRVLPLGRTPSARPACDASRAACTSRSRTRSIRGKTPNLNH